MCVRDCMLWDEAIRATWLMFGLDEKNIDQEIYDNVLSGHQMLKFYTTCVKQDIV